MTLRAVVGLVVLVAACGGSTGSQGRPNTPEGSRGGDEALASCEGGSGRRETGLDVNGDGTPDVRRVYEGNTEMCREVDLNFDGRKDVFHYFDERGQRVRLEDDLDFDGRIDQITFYRGGGVSRRELDTNFDNRFDTWEYFENGRIARTERDTNADRRVDYWERYADGRTVQIQYDEDGDGRADRTDDNPDLGDDAAQPAPPASGGGEAPPVPPGGAPQPTSDEPTPGGSPS
jgi:hypothetical protein